MNLTKKLLSLVLSVSIGMTFIPSMAFANGTDDPETTTVDREMKNTWSEDGKRYYDNNGEMVTGAKKIGKNVWYFEASNGKKHTKKGLFKREGKTYYAKKGGKLVTGWTVLKKHKKEGAYYFYKKGDDLGAMARKTKVGYQKIPKSGRLGMAYVRGIKVLNKKGWKLKKAFNYAMHMSYGNKYMRRKNSEAYANYGFVKRSGNCYVYAAQFYIMAKLLGYDAHQIKGSVFKTEEHSWVEIKQKPKTVKVMKNGKMHKKRVSVFVYDPEFEWQEKYGKRHRGAIPDGFKIWYGKKGTWKYVKNKKMN